MTKRYAALLLLSLAAHASGEEATLAGRYEAARAAYVDAHSQYQDLWSAKFMKEHLQSAGKLPSTDEGWDQLLESVKKTVMSEARERKELLAKDHSPYFSTKISGSRVP